MKVFELLAIPHLANMNIIAGESGKHNEVYTVNMMDAPDIINFLKPNELLVTTAYHLKDDPHSLAYLIKAMSEQGCAALGIKTKRFLKEVPEDTLKLADELSLPIIELPLELSLGEVVNHSLRAILDQRATELTLALETHKQFTDIIMQGKGIQQLLQDLSKMINRPVQLLDQHFNLIHNLYPKSALFSLQSILQTGEITILSSMSHISFSIIANKQTYSLYPIHIAKKKISFLIISGEIENTNYMTSLIIEQATNVISFSLMKENAIRQHDRSIRNDFFLHFLDDTFSSQEEIINRAAEFSLQNDQSYICVVGEIDSDDQRHTYTQHQEKIDDIYDFIESEVNHSTPNIHFFTKGKSCILLYEVQESTKSLGLSIEPSLRQLQEKVSNNYENTISFGISNVSPTFLHITSAYKEAMDALSQGEFSKKTEYIQTYQTKDITELLRLIPQSDLRDFYTFALSGFTAKNIEEEQTLLETLFVFLETHCQISETAKRLFVHRNTVVYRIEKCEELLGKDVKDPETTLQIRLALRIRALMES